MYFLTKNKTKQFFIVLLALLMAITMAFATACSKDNDDDPYNAKDYSNEEDFYYDHYDDFFDYEEAEDYYNEYND